jgi:hypothetical protein
MGGTIIPAPEPEADPAAVNLTGVTLDLPEGEPGNFYIPNDGVMAYFRTETGWLGLGPLFPFTQPELADFGNAINPEFAVTIDDSLGGLTIHGQSTSTQHFAGYFHTVPAGGATYKMYFTPSVAMVTNSNWFAAVSNGDGNEIIALGVSQDPGDATYGKIKLELYRILFDGSFWTRTRHAVRHIGAFTPLWIRVTVDAGGQATWEMGQDPWSFMYMDFATWALDSPMIGFGMWFPVSDLEGAINLWSFEETPL